MNTPKSIEELASRVEHVVREHLAEVRQAVQDAVTRALEGSTNARLPKSKSGTTRRAGTRRTSRELTELQAKLEELVRAKPGESMTTFAGQLQISVRSLHRPMTLLKRAGRVRTVGERSGTRYYPAISRASSAA